MTIPTPVRTAIFGFYSAHSLLGQASMCMSTNMSTRAITATRMGSLIARSCARAPASGPSRSASPCWDLLLECRWRSSFCRALVGLLEICTHPPVVRKRRGGELRDPK